jgi:hypothetical protein
MNPFRILVSSVMAVCLSVLVGSVACQTANPPAQTTPPPSASGHKLGLDVNYVNSVGSQVVEQGLFEWNKNWADGTDSGGSLTEIPVDGIGPGPLSIPVSQCQFVTSAALTASQTTYATLNVYKRPGNNPDGGVGPTLIASASTTTNMLDAAADAPSTGSWFAWQNVVIPPVTGAFVAPGDQITVSITKTSTGVGVPQGILTCYSTIQ